VPCLQCGEESVAEFRATFEFVQSGAVEPLCVRGVVPGAQCAVCGSTTIVVDLVFTAVHGAHESADHDREPGFLVQFPL